MRTLFGSKGSGSAAVEAALLRCGLPCRQVVASTWGPGPALDELLRFHPLGQIPTLVLDNGQVLTESAAILIHLGLTYPQVGLLPTDPAARAQALRGLVFVASNCYAAIGVTDYPEPWLPGAAEPAQSALRQGARARLHALWDVFAEQFPAPETYYGGIRLGGLDLLVAVVSRWSGARAYLQASRPSLAALVQRADLDNEFRAPFLTQWPSSASV